MESAASRAISYYTHFSLLKTIEGGFGLPCLNHACDADVQAMADLFAPVPPAQIAPAPPARFRATLTWTKPNGDTGSGNLTTISTETKGFWFFSPDNVDLVFKVLDGREHERPLLGVLRLTHERAVHAHGDGHRHGGTEGLREPAGPDGERRGHEGVLIAGSRSLFPSTKRPGKPGRFLCRLVAVKGFECSAPPACDNYAHVAGTSEAGP